MKKRNAIIYVVLFLILFLVPTVATGLFGYTLDSSTYERRKTTEKPEFTWKTIREFPTEYETYYNDVTPFHDKLIQANSLLNLYVFKESPLSNVIIGKDGWLFYNPDGGDGDPVDDYRGENYYSEEYLAETAANLTAVKKQLNQRGMEFAVVVAPNKECIYGDSYLTAEYRRENDVTRGDQMVTYLKENTDVTVVYPKDAILSAIEEYPKETFYYKTDTHWNQLGAYIGTKELLKELNVNLPELSELDIQKHSGMAGDLAGMLEMTEQMNYDNVYELNGYQKTVNSYSIELDNLGEEKLLYSAMQGDERKIMIVRDSFALSMAPYISGQFNECVLVYRGQYAPQVLKEQKPDIVVLEVVERYIPYLHDFYVY